MSVRRTVCTHVRSYIHIKAHASVCVRAHIRVFASMNFPDESMSAHMHTNIHTYKYTSTRTFAHMRTHARLHTNIEVRKIRDVHIIHTHIHTHECTLANNLYAKNSLKKTVQHQMKCHHSGISLRYSLFANTPN